MKFQIPFGIEEPVISGFGAISHISRINKRMADDMQHAVFAKSRIPAELRFRMIISSAGKGYMGKLDVLDRTFFAEPERFAELINTEIYHGERVLVPEQLKLLKRSYPSLSSVSGERTRDVLIHDIGQDIYYGLEIETESDYSMPERVMVYEASEYEYQIRELYKKHKSRREYSGYRDKKSRIVEDDFLLPTVTMVLYLGEGCWEGRLRLREMFRIPERVKRRLGRMILDYDFPLIEADAVRAGDYHTDLREFFRAMQCRGNLNRLEKLFQEERFQKLSGETQRVIAAHFGNDRLFQEVEEGMSMCKALDDLCERERAIGREKGIEEGRMKERFQNMQRMLQAGMEETQIMDILDCTREELYAIIAP